MSDVHRCLLETMYCLDDICSRNNIEYFLEGGSLLGAVRYGDLIPWDDDIDIEMTRGDFERFINLPKSEFPEGFEVIELPAAKYLLFRGEPFAEEDYAQAITEIWQAEKKYDPAFIGYEWDEENPRIQLEPRGERGYIELVPVKEKI